MKSWDEVADPLSFPIGGKQYIVPPPSIAQVEEVEKVTADSKTAQGMTQDQLFRLATGDELWDQMVADDVPRPAAWRVGMAALADIRQGRAAAEAVWETGLDPTRLASFMAARQKAAEQALGVTPGSKRSRSTAAGNGTRSRASTSGTSSRKTTRRAPAKGKGSTRKS